MSNATPEPDPLAGRTSRTTAAAGLPDTGPSLDSDSPRKETRTVGKRRAIKAAATTLFLRQGYPGTSMDEIAAAAGVSKQTVYKQFVDKEQLFRDIVLAITESADEIVRALTQLLEDVKDVEDGLHEVARAYVTSVLRPEVLQLRRLVIGEADRFPELARTYFQRAPERGLATLASGLEQLAERGLLQIDDPLLAADHFAYLILGRPIDKAMFCGNNSIARDELLDHASAGVSAFLRAYKQP